MEILQGTQILTIPNWAEKLAKLTKVAWSGKDGKCYFPYLPLTTPDFWQNNVGKNIIAGTMVPFVLMHDTDIMAHAALVQKKNGWECGRWVAYPDSPRGAVTQLVRQAIDYGNQLKLKMWVECTQAHTASQKICLRTNLRFAGIGFLDEIDGVYWDIIYFDNASLPTFVPQTGVLGNPLGQVHQCHTNDLRRLSDISKILTMEPGGDLPPTKFHILPLLEPVIKKIISSNL